LIKIEDNNLLFQLFSRVTTIEIVYNELWLELWQEINFLMKTTKLLFSVSAITFIANFVKTFNIMEESQQIGKN
jgi:hypothetical protein